MIVELIVMSIISYDNISIDDDNDVCLHDRL